MADTNAMFRVGVAWLNGIMGAKVGLHRLDQETIEQYIIKDTDSEPESQDLSDDDIDSSQHMDYEHSDNDALLSPAVRKTPIKRKYRSEQSKLANVAVRSYREDDYTKVMPKGRIKKYKSAFAKSQGHEHCKANIQSLTLLKTPETPVRYARTATSVNLSSTGPKFRKFHSISAKARAQLLKLKKNPHMKSSAVVDRQILTLRRDNVSSKSIPKVAIASSTRTVMLTSTPLINKKPVLLSKSMPCTPISVSKSIVSTPISVSKSIVSTPISVSKSIVRTPISVSKSIVSTPKFNLTLAGIMKGSSLSSGGGPLQQNELAKILHAVKQQTPGKIIDLSHSFSRQSSVGKYNAGIHVSSEKSPTKVINLKLDSSPDADFSNLPVSLAGVHGADCPVNAINDSASKIASSTSQSVVQTILHLSKSSSAKELFQETVDRVDISLEQPVSPANGPNNNLLGTFDRTKSLTSLKYFATDSHQKSLANREVSLPETVERIPCTTPKIRPNINPDINSISTNDTDGILSALENQLSASSSRISTRIKKTPAYMTKYFDVHVRKANNKANHLANVTCTRTEPHQEILPESQVIIRQSLASSDSVIPANNTEVDQDTHFISNTTSNVILASTGRISTRMKKTPIYMSEHFNVRIPVVRSLKEIRTSKAVCAEFSHHHSSEKTTHLICSNNNLETEHDVLSKPIHNHLSDLRHEAIHSESMLTDKDDYNDDICSENETDTFRYQYMASLGLESSLSDTEFLSPSKSLHGHGKESTGNYLACTPFHKLKSSPPFGSDDSVACTHNKASTLIYASTYNDTPACDDAPTFDDEPTCGDTPTSGTGSHGGLFHAEHSSIPQLLSPHHQSDYVSDDSEMAAQSASHAISKNVSPKKFVSVVFNQTPVKQERINTVLGQILRPSIIVCRLEDRESCQKSGCAVCDRIMNESVHGDEPIPVKECEERPTIMEESEDQPTLVNESEDKSNARSTIEILSKPLKKGIIRKIKMKHRRGKKIEVALDNLPGEYPCLQCEMVYSFQVSIRNHMMKKHLLWWTAAKPAGSKNVEALQKMLKVLGKLTCPKCGKIMCAAANFSRHMNWCGHENDQFICAECNKSVKCMYRSQHAQKHLTVEEVSCRGRRPAAEKALEKVHDMTQILLDTDSKEIKSRADDNDKTFAPDTIDAEDDDDDEDDEDISEDDIKYKLCPLRNNPVASNYKAMTDMVNEQWRHTLEQECLMNRLFPELLPSHDIWSCDKALIRDEFEPFLPRVKESMSFCQAHQYNHRFSDITEIVRLGLFQSVTANGDAVFFTGGPVWALDWCPVPLHLTDTAQYLATASYHQPDMMTKGKKVFTGPGLIQIWICATLQIETEPPSFSLGMAHSWGCIHDIRWCPMGYWQEGSAQTQSSLSRLGVLAVACSDGSVKVLSIPHPTSLAYHGTEPLIYHAQPAITLRPAVQQGEEFGICMSVDWSPHDRCSLVAAGYANGCVFLWDMNTKSKLLRVAVASTSDRACSEEILYPCRSIMAHAGLVRGVSWNPIINNVLGTCAERSVKLWRTDANAECLLSEKTGKLTRLTHIPVWNSLLSVNDDCYHIHIAGPTLTEPRSSSLPSHLVYHNTAVWDSTYSSWLHLILSCDNSGLVHGNKLLRNTNNIKKANHRKFVLGETFVWPLDKAIPSFEMDKENHKLSQLTVKGNQKDIPSKINNDSNKVSLHVKQRALFGHRCSNTSEANGKMDNDQMKTWSSLPTNYSELSEKYCLVFINHDLDIEPNDVRLRQRHGALLPHDETRSAYPITALYRISACPHATHCSWVAFGGQSGIVRLRKLGTYTCQEPETFMKKLYRRLHKNWNLEIPGDPD